MSAGARLVPTYSPDGRRWRNTTRAVAEIWADNGIVVVTRNRKGEIVCVHFREPDGANPLRHTAHMGQRYVRRRKTADGTLTYWEFAPILTASDHQALRDSFGGSKQELEAYLQRIFRAVPLSCMPQAGPPPPKTPAKVVSIADGRPLRKQPRRQKAA